MGEIVNNPVNFEDISLYEFQQHIFKLWREAHWDIMSDDTKVHQKWSKNFEETKLVNKYIENFKTVKENWLPW